MPSEAERSMPSISWLRTVMDSESSATTRAVGVVGPGGLRRLDGLLRDVEQRPALLSARGPDAFRAAGPRRSLPEPRPHRGPLA